MKSILQNIVATSDSYQKLQEILTDFEGKTFHHHIHILYDIRTILGNKQIKYLEIGSYCGASASLILNHPYPSDVHCIDCLNLDKSHYNGIYDQETTLLMNLQKNKKHNTKYFIHKGYSNDSNTINRVNHHKYDMIFIDGDHSAQGVLNDYNNYMPLLNNGGFLVFDDYLDFLYSPEVNKTVNRIAQEIDVSKYELIGTFPNYQRAMPVEQTMNGNLNEFVIYKL